jgi:hypothetical protein
MHRRENPAVFFVLPGMVMRVVVGCAARGGGVPDMVFVPKKAKTEDISTGHANP